MSERTETLQHQTNSGPENGEGNRAQRRHPDDWRREVTLSVPAAGRILGVGKNCAYGAAQTGEIPTIRIGARLVVPVAALRRKLGEIA